MDADEDTGSIEDEDVDLYNGDPNLITDTLAKGLFERGISISTNSLRKLVRIIIVSEFRIRQNKYCDFSQEELTEIESLAEFELAQAIVRDIGFGDWPVSEITALAILILSRRNISRNDPYDIRKERRHFELAGRIIEWIFNRTDVDLTVYPEMRQELAKHLRGMTYRLNYGLEKRDVGILESKGSNPAFEYAIIAAQLLSEKFGKPVQETEIAYLSYRFYKHFQVISSHRRLNVLVILSNGKNTADLFINELMASFSKYIDRVDVIEFYEVPFVRMDPFDCILTDIPEIHFNVLPPVVRVNYFFNENDLLKLRHYFTNSLLNLQLFRNCFRPELFFRDIDARNKESVIRQMVAKAGAVLDLPDDVLTQVLERERISSTECGNSVAIPHTLYACCDQPSVAVGVLKRPIVWEKERCQLVLLVFNGREEYAPFSMLSLTKAATKSIHFVYNLIKAPGFQEVKENIEEFISHYDF
jgi:lichenan operon transcriptional antiterminator